MWTLCIRARGGGGAAQRSTAQHCSSKELIGQAAGAPRHKQKGEGIGGLRLCCNHRLQMSKPALTSAMSRLSGGSHVQIQRIL